MSAYAHFRDEAAWKRKLGESEYPGVPNLGPEVAITVRLAGGGTKEIRGDAVDSEIVWTLPEHAVRVGDHLNGAPVLAVDAARDGAGNVTWWIAFVER